MHLAARNVRYNLPPQVMRFSTNVVASISVLPRKEVDMI